jgi:hypothetical protein
MNPWQRTRMRSRQKVMGGPRKTAFSGVRPCGRRRCSTACNTFCALPPKDGTRKEIKGPFFRDWFQSVRNLRGWRDGDPFLVNYIGHPIMGAASGYIQIQNDPRGRYLEFEPTRKGYWKSRLKAMAWSAAYSTQFELGPISEASLGNVGRTPRPDGKSPMSYVDLIITPTVGTLWLMGEDALDKHLIQRFEKRVRNQFWRGIVRSFLNPGRSIANAMRFKGPWHRDRRPL